LYGNLLALLFNTIQMPVYFLLPFYLENLLKLSPMAAGLLMTITPVTMALTAPLAGNLSDRIGSSKIVAAAFIILTMAFIILASLGNQTNLLKIGFGLGLMGIGMGMFSSPNSSSVLASIPRDKAGYGGGFMATIRNFAYASGTAGSAAIFTSFLSHGQARHGYVWSYVHASNTVYWLAAAITCLGFLLALTAQPRGDSQTIHDSSPK
jgi:MFS family permease